MKGGFGKLGTSAQRKRRALRRIKIDPFAGIAYHQSDATSGTWEGLLRDYTPPTACRVCGGTPLSKAPWVYNLCDPCHDSWRAFSTKWYKSFFRSGAAPRDGDVVAEWEAKRRPK